MAQQIARPLKIAFGMATILIVVKVSSKIYKPIVGWLSNAKCLFVRYAIIANDVTDNQLQLQEKLAESGNMNSAKLKERNVKLRQTAEYFGLALQSMLLYLELRWRTPVEKPDVSYQHFYASSTNFLQQKIFVDAYTAITKCRNLLKQHAWQQMVDKIVPIIDSIKL